MAGVGAGTGSSAGAGIFSRASRQQYAAIARMRMSMMTHSMRTSRGAFDAVSQVVTWGLFLLWGAGLATGFAFGAYHAIATRHLFILDLLLWGVLAVWQMTPIMAVSFRETVDLSILLRFPLGFGAYYLLFLFFGLFDISTILGGAALTGIVIGAGIADATVLPVVIPLAAVFAAFNLLLTRAIFAWIDRWLAQRRTREIVGVCFFLIVLGVQLLNPALHNGAYGHHHGAAALLAHLQQFSAVNHLLPPGLAVAAVSAAMASAMPHVLFAFGGLLLYACLAGTLLGIRLKKQYQGESLSEAPVPAARTTARRENRALFDVSGPMGAVFVKEARYLTRSYQFLYGLVAPLVLVLVFSAQHGRDQGPMLPAKFVIPMGVLYAFLGLTRMLYNSFGTDGPGLAFYFTSPVPLRTVMLGKNLFHAALLLVELIGVWVVAMLRVGLPDPQMFVVTLCALGFALPLEFMAANIISIQAPYAMNFSKLGRPQGARANSLLSLLIQVIVGALGAAVFFVAYRLGNLWLAAPIFLILGAIGFVAYWRVLGNVEMLARRRIEPLLQDLAKTVN